jgi:hypothetical protein
MRQQPMTPAERLAMTGKRARSNFFGAAGRPASTVGDGESSCGLAPAAMRQASERQATAIMQRATVGAPMAPMRLSSKQLKNRPIGARGADGKCVPTAWAKQSCVAEGKLWDDASSTCFGATLFGIDGPCYLGEPDNLGARDLDGKCVPEKWAIQSCLAANGRWSAQTHTCIKFYEGLEFPVTVEENLGGVRIHKGICDLNSPLGECSYDNLAACGPQNLLQYPPEFEAFRYPTSCTTDADCPNGVCDQGLRVCRVNMSLYGAAAGGSDNGLKFGVDLTGVNLATRNAASGARATSSQRSAGIPGRANANRVTFRPGDDITVETNPLSGQLNAQCNRNSDCDSDNCVPIASGNLGISVCAPRRNAASGARATSSQRSAGIPGRANANRATFRLSGAPTLGDPGDLGSDCSGDGDCNSANCSSWLGVCIPGLGTGILNVICGYNEHMSSGGCVCDVGTERAAGPDSPCLPPIAHSLLDQACTSTGGRWNDDQQFCDCGGGGQTGMSANAIGQCVKEDCFGLPDRAGCTDAYGQAGLCNSGHCDSTCVDELGNQGAIDAKTGECIGAACGTGQGRGLETGACRECVNGFMADGIHCNICPTGLFYDKVNDTCECNPPTVFSSDGLWNCVNPATKEIVTPAPPTCVPPMVLAGNSCVTPKTPNPKEPLKCNPESQVPSVDDNGNAICKTKKVDEKKDGPAPDKAAAPAKSNTGLYVALGAVALVAVGAAVMMGKKKRA